MKSLLLALSILLIACKHKPEFYIDNKPYYTTVRCLDYKTETVWKYHYGYNYYSGKWEHRYGPQTVTECIKTVIDTIEIVEK